MPRCAQRAMILHWNICSKRGKPDRARPPPLSFKDFRNSLIVFLQAAASTGPGVRPVLPRFGALALWSEDARARRPTTDGGSFDCRREKCADRDDAAQLRTGVPAADALGSLLRLRQTGDRPFPAPVHGGVGVCRKRGDPLAEDAEI